jgi:tetratricopeptide (TPR) repeat protein
MVPMVGIVQVGWQAYADRYTYIPSIGIFIAIVWAAADATEGRHWRREAAIAAAAILLVFAGVTWSQLPYWHDDATLFQHAIAVTSDNPAAEYHLGGDLAEAGRTREAIPHLQKMIRMQPDFYAAYYMLGKAQAAEGDTGLAIEDFSGAVRLKPDYAEAYYARAEMYVKAGNQQAAEPDFRQALKCGLSAEWAADSHNGLGVMAAQRGDLSAAVEEFSQAVRLRPDLAGAQRNLANALVAQGRVRDAISQLEQALSATRGDSSIRSMLDGLRARN